METIVDHERELKSGKDVNEYREAVRSLIKSEVKNVIDEEMKMAAQELLDEQRNAIKEMVEEHRVAIREAVEEEKKAIRSRIEEMRKSILNLSLG